MKGLGRRLLCFTGRLDLPGEALCSATTEALPSGRLAPVSARRLATLLLDFEPIWAVGAGGAVYLSVLGIINVPAWFGLAAGVLPFLLRRVIYGYLSRRTPFDLPITILLLAGLIGIGVSPNRSLSWGVYQTCLISVLLYYSLVNHQRPRLLMKCGIVAAAVAILLVGGYVFLQEPTSLPLYAQLKAWLHPVPSSSPPGWIDPPLAASACGATVVAVALTIVVAGVAAFRGRTATRITAGVITALLLGLLVASGCHATWPVLGAGMLIVLGWRSRWLLLSLPAWLGIAFCSLTVWRDLTVSQGMDWVMRAFEYKWSARWEGVLHMLGDRPVTGWGLGVYPAVYSEYGVHGPHAHNSYLQFYCDFGIVGVAALIVAGAVLIRMGFQVRDCASNDHWKGAAVGAWVAIVAVAAYGLVESAPACIFAGAEDGHYYYAISPLFAILGAALVLSYQRIVGCRPRARRQVGSTDES